MWEGRPEVWLSWLRPLSTEQDLGVCSGCSGIHSRGLHGGTICITLHNQVSRPTACGPHPALSWPNQYR